MDSKVLNGIFDSFKRKISANSDAFLVNALQNCCVEFVTKSERHPLADVIHGSQQTLPVILIKSNEEIFQDLHSPLHPKERVLSVDGSPLKLRTFGSASSTVSADEPQQESTLHGVPVRLARRLLGTYNLCNKELNLPPMWVLCDAHDKVVALSSQKVCRDDRAMTLLNCITVEGPVGRSQLSQLQKYCPPLDGKVECSALFNVLGKVPAAGDLQKFEISVQWDKRSALGQVPSDYAKTNLNVRPAIGDEKSAAQTLHQELKCLKNFIAGLQVSKVIWSGSKNPESVISCLKSLCKGIEKGSKPTLSQKKASHDASPVSLLLIEQRKDLDFTEQVWNILKGSTSHKALHAGFNFILTRLQSNDLAPMVHRMSKSRLAQMVRDSYHQQMVVPDLESTTPLRLLIEIGLEKLTRDYCCILLGKDLVFASDLSKFTCHQSSYSEQLGQLEKLHHCLEVVIMLEQYLDLPSVILGSATRQMLCHFASNDADPKHVFHFLVKTTEVAHCFESHAMNEWRMDCVRDGYVSSVLLTNANALPHLLASRNQCTSGDAHEMDSYLLTLNKPCLL